MVGVRRRVGRWVGGASASIMPNKLRGVGIPLVESKNTSFHMSCFSIYSSNIACNNGCLFFTLQNYTSATLTRFLDPPAPACQEHQGCGTGNNCPFNYERSCFQLSGYAVMCFQRPIGGRSAPPDHSLEICLIT